MNEFKLVKLADIKSDPNQPRKMFHENDLQELTQSIKEKGILQPILIRPIKAKKGQANYMLVCGERRWRCAVEAELSDIPAMIRELSDAEALELQIVENLQRKDVHPMEEAIAFSSLFVTGKTDEEIANRVGKSVYFVRQRMKLNALNEVWKKAFFENRLSITDALKISVFDAETQDDIWESESGSNAIDIDKWTIKKYSGRLKEATFPIDDSALVAGVGACIGCRFNSASSALFPEDVENPICSKPSCFADKTEAFFKIELENAKADPDTYLINYSYDSSVKSIDGLPVLQRMTEYLVLDEPDELLSREDWKEEYNYDDEEAEYIEYVDDWNKENDTFQKEIASGKWKKGFVVSNHSKGKYLWIQLKKNKNSNSKVDDENSSDEVNVDEEISRIQDKEKRAKEIDGNKLWDEIKPLFEPTKKPTDEPLTQIELDAVATALYEKSGYDARRFLAKNFKGKETSYYQTTFSKVTEKQLNQMLRVFFLMNLPPNQINQGISGYAELMMNIGREYFPEKIEAAEKLINESAANRIEKVNAKIKSLKAQKK